MRLTQNHLLGNGLLSSKTKGDALFHAVRRAILLHEIKPGEAITEPQIGHQFACSQGTVREALMRLQEEGLVQRRGYRGTIVTKSSLAEGVQMADIRIKLEMEGARHSAENLSDEGLAAAEACLEQMDRAVEIKDFYALSELDRKFHLMLFSSSGLAALEPILTRCMLHMHLQTFASPEPKARAVAPAKAHRPIIEALHAKDATKAAQALQAHIQHTISRWSPSLKTAMDAR